MNQRGARAPRMAKGAGMRVMDDRVRGRGHAWMWIAVAAAAGALLLPGTALAAGEAESNDGIHIADGPLVPGTDFDGTIGSTGDFDWWIVHVSGAGVLDVNMNNLTDTNEGCCGLRFEVLDADGDTLNSRSVSEGQTGTISYTTPGPGTYHVWTSAGANDRYRLTVNGPVTSGSRPLLQTKPCRTTTRRRTLRSDRSRVIVSTPAASTRWTRRTGSSSTPLEPARSTSGSPTWSTRRRVAAA